MAIEDTNQEWNLYLKTGFGIRGSQGILRDYYVDCKKVAHRPGQRGSTVFSTSQIFQDKTGLKSNFF